MKKKLPTTSSLQCFDAVAQHLNMTSAGKSMHLTQSAISRQIKNLEKHIGQPLFNRVDNNLSLTRIGEQYAAEIHELLERIDEATKKISIEDKTSRSVDLRVVTEPTLAMHWLIPRLVEFNRDYPDIEVDLSTDFWTAVRNLRKCHLAILWGDGNWEGYEAELLRHEIFIAVASPEVLGSRAPTKTIGDVLTFPFLHHRNPLSSTQMWLHKSGLSDKEIAMTHGQHYETLDLLLEAVRYGLGISILPYYLVQNELTEGTLVLACEQMYVPNGGYYIVFVKERKNDYGVRQFRKWILTHKEKRQPKKGVSEVLCVSRFIN